MIKSVLLNNFRGFQEKEFSLPERAYILGKNEAGKTTIAHAIAFAFTGMDLFGNRAPTHLISTGSDSCFVQVETGKVILKRSLTVKKTTRTQLIIGDMQYPVTQAQLEQKLSCSGDLFLSVFSPGFFWTLPEAKKIDILSEVLPEFDLIGFLQERTGCAITETEMHVYNLRTRRPDLIVTMVAKQRTETQKQIYLIDGQIQSIQSRPQVQVRPAEPAELSLLPVIENLKEAWKKYRNDCALVSSLSKSYTDAMTRNEENAKRRAVLEEELRKITPDNSLELRLSEIDQKIQEVRGQFQRVRSEMEPTNSNVTLVKEVDSEVCPTCGQVVGLKHRERVREENNKLLLEFEKEKKQRESRNAERFEVMAELENKRKELEDERAKIGAYANSIRQRTAQMEGELAGLRDVSIPVVPSLPEPPSENEYSFEEEQRVRSVVERFKRELVEFEYSQKEALAADQKVIRLLKEREPLVVDVERLSRLEAALKEAPLAKSQQQAEDLKMDGYVLDVGESGVSLKRDDGMPFQLLSTGAMLKANIAFSLKLNSMMKRPISVMFIDNAELCDDIRLPESGLQVLMAYVSKEHDGVEIKDLGGK